MHCVFTLSHLLHSIGCSSLQHINPVCAGSAQSVWECNWRAEVNPFLARTFIAQSEMTGCGCCHRNGSTAMTRHRVHVKAIYLTGTERAGSHPAFVFPSPFLASWTCFSAAWKSWLMNFRQRENEALYWHTHLLVWKWVTLYTVPNRKHAFINLLKQRRVSK